MYIDTHCHLNFSEFDDDRAMVVGNAKKAGVKQFIVPGADYNSSKTAALLAKKNSGVIFAAVGFHPYEAVHTPQISKLRLLLTSFRSSIMAIGEIGLDYHKYKGEMAAGKKNVQQMLFWEQLLLALEFDLPVIIHCREAFSDVFDLLTKLPKNPRGVLHCFSGGLQDIRAAKKLGLYIGIDGNVTYSKHLSMIVPYIRLDMLLLETDAPYLTPAPHRGTRNEPKHIPLIAKSIAEHIHAETAKIRSHTTQNAKHLFRI